MVTVASSASESTVAAPKADAPVRVTVAVSMFSWVPPPTESPSVLGRAASVRSTNEAPAGINTRPLSAPKRWLPAVMSKSLMVMPSPVMAKSTAMGARLVTPPAVAMRRVAEAGPVAPRPGSLMTPAMLPVKPTCTGSLSVTVTVTVEAPDNRTGGRSPGRSMRGGMVYCTTDSGSLTLSSLTTCCSPLEVSPPPNDKSASRRLLRKPLRSRIWNRTGMLRPPSTAPLSRTLRPMERLVSTKAMSVSPVKA